MNLPEIRIDINENTKYRIMLPSKAKIDALENVSNSPAEISKIDIFLKRRCLFKLPSLNIQTQNAAIKIKPTLFDPNISFTSKWISAPRIKKLIEENNP